MRKFIFGIIVGLVATLFGESVLLSFLLKNKTFKEVFTSTTKELIDRILYGNRTYAGSRIQYHNPSKRPTTYTSYNRIPNLNVKQEKDSSKHSYILSSREDKERVFDAINDIIERSGLLTISDVHELLGLPTNYASSYWGWTSLEGCRTQNVREGFLISFPEPTLI